MTTFDRFDPFERRIADAIDEIAAARVPDYLDNVFQRTRRTSQRPRWSFPERWLPLDWAVARRPALSVAFALLLAGLIALAGVAIWVAGQSSRAPNPIVVELSPGTWRTPHDGISFGLPSGATSETLTIGLVRGARSLAIWEQGFPVGQTAFESRIVDLPDFEVELTVTQANSLTGRPFLPGTPVSVNGTELAGCKLGDVGRYRWSVTNGSSVLIFQSLGDACPSREAVLARAWTLLADVVSPHPSTP